MIHLTLGTGPVPLVAVHGIQGTHAAWIPVARACADSARFVLPDLRGRGDALRGSGPEDYALAAFADDLGQVVREEVGEAPYLLAGWSMGVSVVLEYLRRPDARAPQALVLLSGTPCPGQAPWFAGLGDALLAEIAAREKRLGLTRAADHQAVAWTWAGLRHCDHRALLPTIGLPTLILHGSADPDSPLEHARWLAAGLPRAELCVIEGAGHSLLTENTAEVAERIRTFIGTIDNNQEPS
ncbi:alpha/beta fold hydrolase [Stutzerimonas azotifigens]|uniref:alpha/beta fold hydrolase n=1 Tax=Stutzerimonas azotifigens TaxID=291995 RepID=UPI00041A8B2D|nr:alpha/beta hydrolase [Stutzerimonas azotifigens]